MEALKSKRNYTIRPYRPEDCRPISQLFYNTVHTVNRKDYTEMQVCAWATGTVDLEAWNRSFSEHRTLVALDGETIVGFGDMDQTGYLDRLYVHQDYQGQGIASALCEQLETAVQGKAIVTHASITARPFFEKRGYHVVREQQVERQGVLLTNYVMEKAGDGRRTAPACDAAGKSLTPEKT
ncbi:MAG TPA: GNAT family N-acetyltransferase [Candidatus Ventrimonas merdavium]|nr:GNAT family N-acetyltransferase [Candidatus Ventrimonas merdavium]